MESIITHASKEPITSIKTYDCYSNVVKGCLFFGGEGNDYNLAGECNYQYNMRVSNPLAMASLNYHHDYSTSREIQSVFTEIRSELELCVDDEELSLILDDTMSIDDFDVVEHLRDEAQWIIQQYQGILAHRLGYDHAVSTDEQGAVYIVYCAGRESELTEVEVNKTI